MPPLPDTTASTPDKSTPDTAALFREVRIFLDGIQEPLDKIGRGLAAVRPSKALGRRAKGKRHR